MITVASTKNWDRISGAFFIYSDIKQMGYEIIQDSRRGILAIVIVEREQPRVVYVNDTLREDDGESKEYFEGTFRYAAPERVFWVSHEEIHRLYVEAVMMEANELMDKEIMG